MRYSKKLGAFLYSIASWYFSIIPWATCLYCIIFFGAGFPMLAWCITKWGWFQDGNSSYFLKPNKKYGSLEYYSYTDTITHDVYDNGGSKVGTIETKGETHSGWKEDTREFVAKYPIFMLYILYLPIQKILTIVLSFLALFTSRFYVSVKAPDDYTHIKYYRGLHSLFNIVAQRSEKAQLKLTCKLEKKEQKKREIQFKKEQNKQNKEAKKKERSETADKILGVVLKILGIVGVAVALYFILR